MTVLLLQYPSKPGAIDQFKGFLFSGEKTACVTFNPFNDLEGLMERKIALEDEIDGEIHQEP